MDHGIQPDPSRAVRPGRPVGNLPPPQLPPAGYRPSAPPRLPGGMVSQATPGMPLGPPTEQMARLNVNSVPYGHPPPKSVVPSGMPAMSNGLLEGKSMSNGPLPGLTSAGPLPSLGISAGVPSALPSTNLSQTSVNTMTSQSVPVSAVVGPSLTPSTHGSYKGSGVGAHMSGQGVLQPPFTYAAPPPPVPPDHAPAVTGSRGLVSPAGSGPRVTQSSVTEHFQPAFPGMRQEFVPQPSPSVGPMTAPSLSISSLPSLRPGMGPMPHPGFGPVATLGTAPPSAPLSGGGTVLPPPGSGLAPPVSGVGPPVPHMGPPTLAGMGPPSGPALGPSPSSQSVMFPGGAPRIGPPVPGMMSQGSTGISPPAAPTAMAPGVGVPSAQLMSSAYPPPTSSATRSVSPASGMPYSGSSRLPPPQPVGMPPSSLGGSAIPRPGMLSAGQTSPTQGPPVTSAQGMGGMANRYPGAGVASSDYSQGSQAKRLNPDDMPSPLQVMEEDRNTRSGEYITNLKGAVPPLVTTNFWTRDGGNISPRFIRSSVYSIPSTPDMMKQASVPFGLVISPLADKHVNEDPLYLGTSLNSGPVRCNRCKAYMSPLMAFMDGGRRFQCTLCKQINETPPDFYCHMDSQGARADKYQRPELCLGAYEYIATPEYCRDKLLPKEPAFIFVMEMSQMMMQRGIISFLCQNMQDLLQHLPKDAVGGTEAEKTALRVGFITYDSSVHFYKLTGLAPEMCVVCDRDDMFVPVPDGVLCDIEEVSSNIDKLMESIPQNFQNTRETSGALSCAIQAGMSALKASGRTGKLFVFQSSLPVAEGPGKLRNREDRKLLATDKEKAILAPQGNHYSSLAQDLVSVGCGVDLYMFNDSYVDLATVGQVCRLTGGQCYKYTYFQLNKDGMRLLEDLKSNISREIAFDAVMRVRTSTGVRPIEFYGHFFMSNTHDIEFAVVDSSKAVAIEVKHDDKLTEEDGVYIQAALLYTSVGGQRRLRILNLALNTCNQLADLYKSCELDTLMNFFGKQAMFKLLDIGAKQMKENLIARTAQILACYRKNCASPSSAGQLILPELMKLLPLYINCLTKCDALSGGQDLTCDDRSWHIYQLSTMNIEASVVYFYPRLIPISDASPEGTDIPHPLRCSFDKLRSDGAYLLENGLFMFMWVGSATSSTWMNEVFTVSAPHQLDPMLSELPDLDNPTSQRVRSIIDAVRAQRKNHLRLFVVPQQGKHEVVMRNFLVEDKGVFGSPSYVDFLCHIHKEIRTLLS